MARTETGITDRGSRVVFFKNAKVDPNYEDVILPLYFNEMVNSMCQQKFGATSWIAKAIPYSYIKPTDEKIRVDVNNLNTVEEIFPGGIANPTVEDLIECNYLAFQNTASHIWNWIDDSTNPPTSDGGTQNANYPYRWYFAFITKVEYVNDRVYDVYFDIDVFTTYWTTPTNAGSPFLTDYRKQTYVSNTIVYPCFVEREHSNTDGIGENYEEEGLDTGDYVVAGDLLDLFGTWQVMVMASEKLTNEIPPATEPPDPQTFANIFTPVAMYAGLNASQPQMIQEIINAYTELGKADSIINVIEYPSSFGTNQVAETVEPAVTMPNRIDGYAPKNNKLFIYPYNYLVGSNRSGMHAIYKWELWNTAQNRGSFKRYSCAIGNPTAILVPQNYRGITGDDYESSIMWQKSPVCPYNSDAFKAYWAQNKNQIGMGMGANLIQSISGAITGGIGLAMGNPLAVLGGGMTNLGGLIGVEQKLAKMQDYQAVPDQAKGNINNDYIMAGKNLQGFQIFKMQIRANKARIIDDYFTAYGYATKKVKVPNFYSGTTRTKFCYVKTQGAKIRGDFPAPVKAKMESILNKGVRFWKNYATYLDLSSNPIGS